MGKSGLTFRLPGALLLAVLLAIPVSYYRAYEPPTWWLEALPVLLGILILVPVHLRYRFTTLLCILLAFHAMVLLLGAHYTYANVPLGEMLREAFDFSRNHYDRFGHLVQGFVPAILVREWLLRTSPLRPGKWLFAIISFSVLGFSALYELIEWGVSISTEDGAASFLGMQGDIWDTQADMLCALIGAIVAQLTLARLHDRQLVGLRMQD
jgi:putative membrane protein